MGLWSHLKAQEGKIHFHATVVVSKIVLYGLSNWDPQFLSGSQMETQSLTMWASPYGLLHQSQQGWVCQQDRSYILCNVIMKVKSLYLSHITLVKIKSGILSTLKGRGLHIVVTNSRWDNWHYAQVDML